ncbi:MAG: transposase, partial [Thermoplasmata archaeon]
MVKGNVRINKKEARRVENGKIVKDLPLINYNGDLLPLFKVISPSHCNECGSKLHINKSRKRYVLSSYETIEIPVNYWQCSNDACNTYYTDDIVGVTGSNNYSDEFLDKLFYTRYNSKTSLFNTRTAGEILTGDLGKKTRTACPSTLWKYDQEKGSISLEKLRNTDVNFNGIIYSDGYWVKNGWRKFLEKSRGREFDESEWKRIRYKVIYVIATADKVILDFKITDIRPPYFALIPLFSRVKKRLGVDNIK